MKRDEAKAQIQRMLGYNKSPTVSTDIDENIRFIQNELESEATLPFFLRKTETELLTVPGENIIERPTDFIRLWNEEPLAIVNDEGTPLSLKQGPQSVLRARFADSSRPMGFTEVGEEFHLWPVPTVVYPLIFTYYAQDDVLWANVENKWLKYLPGLIIGRAGFITAVGLRDENAQKLFGALAAAGTEKLNQMSTAQDESGAKPIIGGED